MTTIGETSMRRPHGLKNLNEHTGSYLFTEANSIRDELLEHSRYIRDYLAPMLDRTSELPASELGLLHNIFDRLNLIPVTMPLLRYSRIEKALLTMTRSSASGWPVDIVEQAEDLLLQWEIGLGQSLTDVKTNLLGPGGGLEGLRPATVSHDLNLNRVSRSLHDP